MRLLAIITIQNFRYLRTVMFFFEFRLFANSKLLYATFNSQAMIRISEPAFQWESLLIHEPDLSFIFSLNVVRNTVIFLPPYDPCNGGSFQRHLYCTS